MREDAARDERAKRSDLKKSISREPEDTPLILFFLMQGRL